MSGEFTHCVSCVCVCVCVRACVCANIHTHLQTYVLEYTHTQPRTQDAQAQTVEKGETATTIQKPALGTRKANAMMASSVSSS